jgi:hypothetical protein
MGKETKETDRYCDLAAFASADDDFSGIRKQQNLGHVVCDNLKNLERRPEVGALQRAEGYCGL